VLLIDADIDINVINRFFLIGISVAPGFASYIEVEENRYKRLSAPYLTNCTDQKNVPGWPNK